MALHAATSQAPGKVILAGEHFAVYGRPALALPVHAVRTAVRLAPAETDTLDSPLAPDDHRKALGLVAAARALVPGWAAQHVAVTVTDSVPVGMGLGSSAAFGVALTRALAQSAGLTWDAEAVRGVAHELERRVHGSPSGLDDAVIAYGQPILFRRGERPTVVRPGGPLRFVLGSVGYAGSTYDAVAGVRRRGEARPDWFATVLGRAEVEVDAAVQAFRAGDLGRLGPALDALHGLLSEIGVSCEDLDRLVHAARSAGAVGAKLVGAGCGGFMLAAVTPDVEAAVSAALRDAGACHVFSLACFPSDPEAPGTP